ncbi:probable WRKY transcription factor protein 1 isoform X2 [Condylostylus longicornis]|uniref:probable WRKY transcription factor protein 1 isoform X2 n=1 Tax=Condylostylus longicornis TaxID=2530218 RepID=UPI00244E31E8|nr:probable WRKY transcription factor protein 1 isoform X2 [Condylostylus longicornis]
MDDFDIEEIFDRSHQNTNWLLPSFDQQDAIYLSSSRQMLEPIMEETSEDEESSSQSYNQYENSAWSSESETGSVIRIELTNDQDSISERGLACPAKRARRDLDLNLLLNSSPSSQNHNEFMQSQLPLSKLPPPVSTKNILNNNNNNNNNSFNNPNSLSTNTNLSSISASNNNYHNSYTISGLIDSPQNIRKFQSRNINSTNNNNNNSDSLAIGSLLDSPIADLPIFRKRFDDFNIYSDSDSLSYNSLSRSSSLIQFESLERQLQNDLSSSSVGSSPSLLSFDATTENSNNNLNYRGSNGSLKRFESSDSRLHQTYYDLDKIDFDKNTPSILFRTSRALSEERHSKSDSESSSDNSILSHEERILARPTSSLNQTPTHCLDSITRRNSSVSGSSRTKSSAENLSEDSGYCEHYQPLRTKSKSIPNFEKFCEEDEFENHKSLENIRYNPLPSRRSSDSSTNSDDEHMKHSIKEDTEILQNQMQFNNDDDFDNNKKQGAIYINKNNDGNNKDKNNKLISSKITITTTTTTTTSTIPEKYSTISALSISSLSPISPSSITSSLSSSSSSPTSSCDEDYCTQKSVITLKVPTTSTSATTTTTTITKYKTNNNNKQQKSNIFTNLANDGFANCNSNNNINNNHQKIQRNNKNKNNNDDDVVDDFNNEKNTLALRENNSKSSTQSAQLNKIELKYACPQNTHNNNKSNNNKNHNNINEEISTAYSAIGIKPISSLISKSQSSSSYYTSSPLTTVSPSTISQSISIIKKDSILNTSPLNSYFPTISSSLPDVRGEEYSFNINEEEKINKEFKYDPNLNRHQNNNNKNNNNFRIETKNLNNSNQIYSKNYSNNSNNNSNNSDTNNSNYNKYNNNNNNNNYCKSNISKKNNNKCKNESIATQNKIFRIDCISPEPIINDYDTIIIQYSKSQNLIDNNNYNNSNLLFGQKSLSYDQLDKCYTKEFDCGNENLLLDDKYLTERSSVPKDLNLLGSDIKLYSDSDIYSHKKNINKYYCNNNNKIDESHNKTAVIKESSQQQSSKQFFLHHQQSSSGYESLANCSEDSNCYGNNSFYSDNDNFDVSELSFSWNDTTVIKRGNNSANEKRAIYANSNQCYNNDNNNTGVILRNKNKQQQQLKRYSGEYSNFTGNSKSYNSGLNYMNASYQDLTLLDYSGKNFNSSPTMDGSNLKRSSREIITGKRNSYNDSGNETAKGNYLLDEISENFDKNLSILSDRNVDSDKLKDFLDAEKISFEEKPCPPIRHKQLKDVKNENLQAEPSRPPIKKPPRRNLKSHQNNQQFKQPKTFDVDPSIMKTSYAESLERCNFDPKEISTQDLTEAIKKASHPIHSTPIKRGFVSSTPNLHTFKVDKVTEDFDDLKISSASNSMQRLPQDKKLGILVPSGSKQSLGKSVNFSPVVAEYSFRDRSGSGSYDPDSLEEITDSIVLANTVANEKYSNGISNVDVVDSNSIGWNKKVLRETNFEWNASAEEQKLPSSANDYHNNDHQQQNKNMEKPQKVIATIINNKNNSNSNTIITTSTTTTTTTIPQQATNNNNSSKTIVLNNNGTCTEQHFQTSFSKKTNANEASNSNESANVINNINNGNEINTVNLKKNNNKNLIDKSDFGEKNIENNKNKSSNNIKNSNNKLQQQQQLKENINDNLINKIKMEQQNNVNIINLPSIQNGINFNEDHNIENNIKNVTKNLIQSEKITNNNTYNYNGTKNGTANNNHNNNNNTTVTTVTTTKVITTPTKKIQNSSKSNKTYSSAGNSPQSIKPEYTQSPHLATTVPLNPAHSNELLNTTKYKGKSEDKNKSFLSRFAGNFRFSLRRKPKKTLPNEPMPTSVTEQQQTFVKNNRNIFGGSKKKSIADGAVKSKSNSSTKSASNSRDSRESPDFIYIPLKGPIPSHQNNQININDSGNSNNIIQKEQEDQQQQQQQQQQQLQQNGHNGIIENTNHMLNQVTGKPPLPKQPPRVIIGEKGIIHHQQYQQQQQQYQNNNNNSNNNNMSTEDKLLSMQYNQQCAGQNNAQYNGEFNNIIREKRSKSQPRDGDTSYLINVGNNLGKFLDNERYFYSSDYQFDETMNGNGSYNNNSNNNNINKMNIGGGGGNGGIQMQNGCNKLPQQNGTNNIIKNNYDGNFNNDYVPPPTQFTDEKPPSGKVRKSSSSGAGTKTGGGGGGGVSGGNVGCVTNNKNKIGLIETNLDTHETVISGKTQSLMELGPNHSTRNYKNANILRQQNDRIDDDDDDDVEGNNHHHGSIRRPHKSMEFLLDKENQKNAASSSTE